MSLDKLVDSTQLDSDLTSVADAIRAKSGGSGQLAFPSGFVSEIGNIPSGETGYYSTWGYHYLKNTVYPETVTDLRALYYANGYGWQNIESISGLAQTTTGAPGNQFRSLSNLKTVNLPRACHFYATAFRDCKKLESVELGSIGYPVVVTRSTTFQNDTQAFTITMYVNASTLAEAQAITDVGALAPWGATNATIIYKSSTTGEVLV